MDKHFFCISYFDGPVEWINDLNRENYVVYAKSDPPDELAEDVIIRSPNVGYNIHSYLRFIVDRYDDLPEVTIFCKNNVFPRHVRKEVFFELVRRKIFTPIEDPALWDKLSFPVSCMSSDGGYLELNNSWYVKKYPYKYFSSFNEFYKFVFDVDVVPTYIRFAPGANYVVPRENIRLRSRSFYENLITFIEHSQFSCESHYAERALFSIFSSAVAESKIMSSKVENINLELLIKRPGYRGAAWIVQMSRRKIFEKGCSLLKRFI